MDDLGQLPGMPIDRGWAWVIVAACGVATFLMVGMSKSMGIVLTEMVPYFEAPRYKVYMVFGVACIVYTITAPLSLVLGEIFTGRRVVMCGGVVALVGISLGSLMVNIEYVIVTIGIGLGIGNGFLYGNVLVILGTYFHKRRSLANGLALAGASIGTLTMPPVFQILLERYHLFGTVLIMAAAYFNVVACGALFRPVSWYSSRLEKIHNRTQHDAAKRCDVNGATHHYADQEIEVFEDPAHKDGVKSNFLAPKTSSALAKTGDFPGGELGASTLSLENVLDADERSQAPSFFHKVRMLFDLSILRNHVCQLLLLFSPFAFFGYFNFILFLPAVVSDRGVVDIHRAWLVSVCGISDLVARVVTGALADLDKCPRYYIIIVAHFVLGVNMILFTWATDYRVMMAQCVVYGLSSGAYVSVYNVVIIDFLGLAKMPKALAFILLLQGVGASTGQVILGGVRDITGSFTVVLILLGASSLLSCLIIALYPLARAWENRRGRDGGVTAREMVPLNAEVKVINGVNEA